MRSRRALPVLLALASASVARAEDALPTCPPASAICIGLAVYVAEQVADPSWLTEQVAAANARFAPEGIGFEVAVLRALPSGEADVTTRAKRDRLGRGRLHPGTITVLVVRRLASVGEPRDAGDIRGVHWRDRADPARRFIILSRIAGPIVLAHELGHFFGLPHSEDPVSIMNKTPRADPPPERRTFTAGELEVIGKHRDELLRSGVLAARPRSAP